MTAFHVGQKVVCIDAHNTTWRKKKFLGLISYTEWRSELIEGEVYTVTGMFIGHEFASGRQGVALTLAEAKDIPGSGFRASRFRPVVERKTDISIFTDMLKNHRTGVPA